MNFDLIFTLALVTIVVVAAFVYFFRVLFLGRVRFSRVDRQGGSRLLSKEIMEGGYWFFQPLGRLLAACHVTPNQLSWSSLVLGLLSGACLAFGHFGTGAVLSALSALLDSLDGIVARETGVASDAGEVLDASVDRFVEFFFFGGLILYYREVPAFLVLTLLAMVGSFMVSYSTAKAEALQIVPPKGSMRRPERALYLTLGSALCPVTIPWLETYREYPMAVGHPMIAALCLVAVLGNISAIERLWVIAKEIRKREAKLLKMAYPAKGPQIAADESVAISREQAEGK